MTKLLYSAIVVMTLIVCFAALAHAGGPLDEADPFDLGFSPADEFFLNCMGNEESAYNQCEMDPTCDEMSVAWGIAQYCLKQTEVQYPGYTGDDAFYDFDMEAGDYDMIPNAPAQPQQVPIQKQGPPPNLKPQEQAYIPEPIRETIREEAINIEITGVGKFSGLTEGQFYFAVISIVLTALGITILKLWWGHKTKS